MAKWNILSENEVLEMMMDEVIEVQSIVGLPSSTLILLLDTFKWDSQSMMDSFFSDENQTFEKARCTNPAFIIQSDDKTIKTCEICFEDLDISRIKNEMCGHIFCGSCWLGYLRHCIVIEGASLRLKCPMQNCQAVLDDTLITEVCKSDQNLLEKYWSLLAKCYVDRKATLSRCPAEHCKNTILLKDMNRISVKCSCGQEFCFACCRPNHFTVPCMLIEEWLAKAFQDDTKLSFVIVLTKKCPNCRTDIEKDGGCPHIHCSRCKSNFCWRCLLPFKDHKQCKGEVEGDRREVEAEVNNGISEPKRFTMFQEKFKKIRENIGFLNLNGNSQSFLWHILTSGENKIILKKLPVRVRTQDKQCLKKENGNGYEENIGEDVFEDILIDVCNCSLLHESQLFLFMEDVVKALNLEILMTSDLGWFETNHLSRAARVLVETQRVVMYSQVFAFYLGCQPSPRRHWSDFLPTALPSNHPKSMDADMFQTNLENLESTCAKLSDSLLEVTFAYFRLKSKMIYSEGGVENIAKQPPSTVKSPVASKQDFQAFLEIMEKKKGHILNQTTICAKRKDAVVSLMEDGFGERTWSFRTVHH